MKVICAQLVIGFTFVNSAAQAAVLYNQPLASWESGYCSPCSGDLDDYSERTFGSFSLAKYSTLQSGRFAIDDISPGSDNLNISIWNYLDGTELFSLSAAGGSYDVTVVPHPDNTLYYAVVDLPNWQLSAGSYWISLFGTDGNYLGWGSDFRSGNDAQLQFNGTPHSLGAYVGFSLSGIAPEPGSLTLFCIGALGLSALRRWPRQR